MYSSPSLDNLRKSIDNVNLALRGTKKVDLFQSGRVDPKMSIEEAVKNFAQLIKEGKFNHIGLSECGAQTLRRACAVRIRSLNLIFDVD